MRLSVLFEGWDELGIEDPGVGDSSIFVVYVVYDVERHGRSFDMVLRNMAGVRERNTGSRLGGREISFEFGNERLASEFAVDVRSGYPNVHVNVEEELSS
jgi:hypothetical protein